VKTIPKFPFNIFRSRKTFYSKNYSITKAWVIKAIAEESTNPPDKMWEGEPLKPEISNSKVRFRKA
jgi:hypothetical protein